MADISKVGFLAVREARVLLCRKRHTTSLLILPGGRIEAGETPRECLDRELAEELGDVRATDVKRVGSYEHRAANDDLGVVRTVAIELYRGTLHGDPQPHAEIVDVVWFGERDDAALLAPSLREAIFPDLVARGLVPWAGFG